MKIRYLDGPRLFRAFSAGAEALMGEREEIDRINVFPVADADTGTNMVATVRAVLHRTEIQPELYLTASSMAAAAVAGARGNSGLILAQYLYGLSCEIEQRAAIAGDALGDMLVRSVRWAREAIGQPVEGTILTVIRDWAYAVQRHQHRFPDLADLLPATLPAARDSLLATPTRLAVLAKAGVVDAGAKGFVTLLEGMVSMMRASSRRVIAIPRPAPAPAAAAHAPSRADGPRYCTEALVTGGGAGLLELRRVAEAAGESVVIAGGPGALHLHVHTDDPASLFARLEEYGHVESPKVDDMRRQYEAAHARRSRVAIVTDSTCDLPQEVLDAHQIHVVSVPIQIGGSTHLDRLTITPQWLYERLATTDNTATTSQAAAADFETAFAAAVQHYQAVLALPLASRLSGTCNAARVAAERCGGAITVVDSRRVSAALGLVVLRAAEAAEDGMSIDQLAAAADSWIDKTNILVAPESLTAIRRSGRLHGVKGVAASLLSVIPVLSLADDGAIRSAGVTRFQAGACAAIEAQLRDLVKTNRVRTWSVVHVNAAEAAAAWVRDLTTIMGSEPLFVTDAAPALGIHAGPGTLGVAVMQE